MSTNDLVSIFLSIELQSYGLYILSTIYRNSELSTTGGLMYFLLGALSSGFILLGWPGNSGLTPLLARPLLPNSGETLVSTVPTHEGGWTNQSCTVTSWKIQETDEGNRGSKLVILINVTEKEQRVKGSRHGIILPCLRCTLQSFYRNSKIGILSNQINKQIRLYSTKIVNSTEIKTPGSFGTEGCSARVGGTNTNLNPWFITGFIEGEGCFVVNVIKNNRLKTGWRIQIEFKIGLHKRDWDLLEKIKKFFGVGKVYKQGENAAQYMTHTVKELAVILNHLDKYPPITAKKISDIKQFKLVVNLILNKEHLTDEGVKKIIYIKASMNKGLSVNNLKHAIFQGIKIHPYLALPEVESAIVDSSSGTLIHHSMEKGQTEPGLIADNKIISEGTFQSPQRSQAVSSIPHPFWLAGFTSAEGCFSVNIINSSTHKIKKRVLLVFSLTQHIREEQLMKSIKDFFSCGFVRKKYNVLEYRIETYSDIENKVIPLFNKHRVEGEKYLNFKDWCKVWELIENKAHLTLEGLNLIKEIKSGMNKRRSTSDPSVKGGGGWIQPPRSYFYPIMGYFYPIMGRRVGSNK
jgi:hypothetical protein